MLSILATNDAFQTQTIILSDKTAVKLTIQYKPMQMGWFITSLEYGSFTFKGMRICTGINILHQFRNKLPFGIACLTTDNSEPLLIDDFKNGKATLYLLSLDECVLYTGVISGQVSA